MTDTIEAKGELDSLLDEAELRVSACSDTLKAKSVFLGSLSVEMNELDRNHLLSLCGMIVEAFKRRLQIETLLVDWFRKNAPTDRFLITNLIAVRSSEAFIAREETYIAFLLGKATQEDCTLAENTLSTIVGIRRELLVVLDSPSIISV